jgi:hypothetical protein
MTGDSGAVLGENGEIAERCATSLSGIPWINHPSVVLRLR